MSLGASLLIVVFAAAALAALRRPEIGLYGLLAIDFLRPQDRYLEFGALRPAAVLVIATAGAALWRLRRGPRPQWRPLLPLLVFIAITVASALAADTRDLAGPAVFDLVKLAIFVALTTVIVTTRRHLETAAWVVAGSLAVLAIGALLQAAALGYPSAFMIPRGGIGGPALAGAGGPFEDNNDFARVLLIALPLWSIGWSATARPLARLAVIGGAAVSIAALAMTFSRAGFITAAALAALVVLRQRPAWRKALALAVVVGGFLLLPAKYRDRMATIREPFTEPSMELRFATWQRGLEMAAARPLLGIGPGGWAAHYPRDEPAYRSPHSIYVEVLAELGALGLLAYLWLMVEPLVRLERLRRSPPASAAAAGSWSAGAAESLQLALLAFLIAGLTLGHPWWAPAMSVLGLALAAPALAAATDTA